jgi:signal transduction histidine kinase
MPRKGTRPENVPVAASALDFRRLFEGASALLLVLEPEPPFVVLDASDGWLRAARAERMNIVGRSALEVFPDHAEAPPGDAGSLRASLERVVASRKPDAMPVRKHDVRRADAEGGGVEERFWSPVNSPVLSASGKILYIVHGAEDVTRFVRAGGSTEREREALERELERFTYSVSHDLRAPLRAIDGFSRILQEDHHARLDDEGRRLLCVVRDNSRKLGDLIDGILEFSRVGRKPLSLSEIDMGRMAGDAMKECEAGGQRCTLMLQPLPPARGDAVLVKRVWLALLSNAIKFSGEGERPVIEVSAAERPGETVYSVKDNGVGFDMEYADKLFGVFQRLHAETQFPGIGMGLAIAQRIVARHGGRAWAESVPNAGATFHFSLPKGDR